MKALLLSLAVAVSFSSASATPFTVLDESTVAFDQQALEQRLLVSAATLIRSRADYEAYMSSFATQSPLSALPAARRAQFEASLRFGPRGLSGFDYSALENDLTQSQIFAALVPFGLQKLASRFVISRVHDPRDTFMVQRFAAPAEQRKWLILDDDVDNSHKDYYCLSRGTCATSNGYICTQNC